MLRDVVFGMRSEMKSISKKVHLLYNDQIYSAGPTSESSDNGDDRLAKLRKEMVEEKPEGAEPGMVPPTEEDLRDRRG